MGGTYVLPPATPFLRTPMGEPRAEHTIELPESLLPSLFTDGPDRWSSQQHIHILRQELQAQRLYFSVRP